MRPTDELLEALDRATAVIRSRTDLVPQVALVLGSGLGDFAEHLGHAVSVPYADIPGIPAPSVDGHAGALVLGQLGEVNTVVMRGRVHLYEGHDPRAVGFGVRLMVHLGATTVLLTNAAGGIGSELVPGDLMAIEDHLNLTGHNVLVGPNPESLGPRFVDMTRAYDRDLLELAAQTATQQGWVLKRGTYAGVLGPTYETPAEVQMLRVLGADAVGMSTVHEAIAARHLGARVLGISCITNAAASASGPVLSHEEVQLAAQVAQERFTGLLTGVIARAAT